jgi:hypothetical protein
MQEEIEGSLSGFERGLTRVQINLQSLAHAFSMRGGDVYRRQKEIEGVFLCPDLNQVLP